GLVLFDSKWKYDSGTGWPSFYDVHSEHIGTKIDKKLFYERTEYHCARCGGHQAHANQDAPQPPSLRNATTANASDNLLQQRPRPGIPSAAGLMVTPLACRQDSALRACREDSTGPVARSKTRLRQLRVM
ncbi:MAG: peptide-methionine (R)-S-oxide reductase, partial [Halofilum sp. (in: g-proteobacteria)]